MSHLFTISRPSFISLYCNFYPLYIAFRLQFLFPNNYTAILQQHRFSVAVWDFLTHSLTLLNLFEDICIRKELVLTSIWLRKKKNNKTGMKNPSVGKEFDSESILIRLFLPFLCAVALFFFLLVLHQPRPQRNAHLAGGNVTRNQ